MCNHESVHIEEMPHSYAVIREEPGLLTLQCRLAGLQDTNSHVIHMVQVQTVETHVVGGSVVRKQMPTHRSPDIDAVWASLGGSQRHPLTTLSVVERPGSWCLMMVPRRLSGDHNPRR